MEEEDNHTTTNNKNENGKLSAGEKTPLLSLTPYQQNRLFKAKAVSPKRLGLEHDEEEHWVPLGEQGKKDSPSAVQFSTTTTQQQQVQDDQSTNMNQDYQSINATEGGSSYPGNDGANDGDERYPLLKHESVEETGSVDEPRPITCRMKTYNLIEGKGGIWGKRYETMMLTLILASILSFVIGTLFVPEYNTTTSYDAATVCGSLCDALWFGNYENNAIAFLGLGPTSILELVVVSIFTVDYLLRLWTADLESDAYRGICGRLRYLPTFYSLVDLASTVPFYVDVYLTNVNVASSQFLRMFRLFRMMRVEGRYLEALTLFDDVFWNQRSILGTALFVGATTWLAVSSLYYMAERHNNDMIYCSLPLCNTSNVEEEVDTSLCVVDTWGFVDCTAAGCPPLSDNLTMELPCWNQYRSIPSSMYFSLLNLFGEYPLIQQHSTWGKVVGTFTAIVAVAVFALPAGIVGNGFEELLEQRRSARREGETSDEIAEDAYQSVKREREREQLVWQYRASDPSSLYNFFHTPPSPPISSPSKEVSTRRKIFLSSSRSTPSITTMAGTLREHLLNFLVLVTTLTLILSTTKPYFASMPQVLDWMETLELVAVVLFTCDYIGKIATVTTNPFFAGWNGWITYVTSFLPIVDLLSFAPYWIAGSIVGFDNPQPMWVKVVRLLRLFRFERYTKAFTTFDDVLRMNVDVLFVTGIAAVIMWIFCSAIMYLSERNNLDAEVASYYKTVPDAMWVTLLNLSGESPLCQYTVLGKITTGFMGLFATGLFGIPIGILGAGFEELVAQEQEEEEAVAAKKNQNGVGENGAGDNNDPTAVEEAMSLDVMDEANMDPNRGSMVPLASSLGPHRMHESSPCASNCERSVYNFVNGVGSVAAVHFEILIYALILVTVLIGILQTVEGQEETFHIVETVAVAIFTVEYVLRFYGAPADPQWRVLASRSKFLARVRYVVSFYSIIDLCAILPLYLATAMPGTWVDTHGDYLRMLRLMRLLKLDKYVPSISLIDDVLRIQRKPLLVTCYAAATLWIIFAGLIYLFEHGDVSNGIDDMPLYGCDGDCTMSDRFQTYIDSLVFTGIHLTGDYPIITYSLASRVTCFFMVILAVGIVSVPSGLIASGFADIIQSRSKSNEGGYSRTIADGEEGGDWYEYQLSLLKKNDRPPPPSRLGLCVDRMQVAVNEFLNGTEDPTTGHKTWTIWSRASRTFIMTIIVGNVLAVMAESIPEIDRAVGNEPGNGFDIFEELSVMVFAIEYALRLFSARKNREALYSARVYATTFFGIVDLLSTAPWFVEQALVATGKLQPGSDMATVFRLFRIFRILQLEDFVTAFSKLDNVFRASWDVLKATGLMATVIWVGCGALFYIFEQSNPNWRECDDSIPLRDTLIHDGATNATVATTTLLPGCYDFETTQDCNDYYGEDMCQQTAFVNMPDALYYTAVFLGGEWGVVDFTWQGRFVCIFLCVAGIALYAIPVGSLFDSFGAVLGMGGDDDDEDGEEESSESWNGET